MIEKFGLTANPTNPQAVTFLEKTIDFLAETNSKIFVENGIIEKLPNSERLLALIESELPLKEMATDIIIVIGGDGTIIRASREVREIPILPVNMGKKGVLAEIEPETAFSYFNKIIAREFNIEKHNRLSCLTDEDIKFPSALNEYLIVSGSETRLIEIILYGNGSEFARTFSDGIIISSAIGSTGHSLSAGGPIIDSSLPAIIISWICPINLSLRPIVVPNSLKLEIVVKPTGLKSDSVKLIIDGQVMKAILSPKKFIITKSIETTCFVRFDNLLSRLKRKIVL